MKDKIFQRPYTVSEFADMWSWSEEVVRQKCRQQVDKRTQRKEHLPAGYVAEKVGRDWLIHKVEEEMADEPTDENQDLGVDEEEMVLTPEEADYYKLQQASRGWLRGGRGMQDPAFRSAVERITDKWFNWLADYRRTVSRFLGYPVYAYTLRWSDLVHWLQHRPDPLKRGGEAVQLAKPSKLDNGEALLDLIGCCYKYAVLDPKNREKPGFRRKQVTIELSFDSLGAWEAKLKSPSDEPLLYDALFCNGKFSERIKNWADELLIKSGKKTSDIEYHTHCRNCNQKLEGKHRQDKRFCSDRCEDNLRSWVDRHAYLDTKEQKKAIIRKMNKTKTKN